jgi:U3 small nucleolar RNA-associated protein 10
MLMLKSFFSFLSTVENLVLHDFNHDMMLMAVFSFDLDPSQLLDLFELCFPVLKTEWEELEVEVDVSLKELSKSNCQELLYQLLDTSDFTALNSKVLICLFWKLGESFIKLEPAHDASVGDAQP